MEQFEIGKPLPMLIKTVLAVVDSSPMVHFRGDSLDAITVCMEKHLVHNGPNGYKITELGRAILAEEARRSTSEPTWGDGLG